MRYGVTVMLTDKAIGIVELAKAVEDRGLDSIWLPEHTHIPTSRMTPPPTGDEVLAEEYLRSVDPFISLAAAAAVTTRLRLGTGVALPAQREPLVTAKALATLDQLSGGRLAVHMIAGGSDASSCGSSLSMLSTVWITLAPGRRWTARMMPRLLPDQAAS